jgi:hypothetical protein
MNPMNDDQSLYQGDFEYDDLDVPASCSSCLFWKDGWCLKMSILTSDDFVCRWQAEKQAALEKIRGLTFETTGV